MNELTGAQRNWSDSTTVSGQQFTYAYDNIGNRTESSAGVLLVSYTVNSLNQYTNIPTPGLKDVIGVALAALWPR